ncbi:MAG: serine hydrolase [Bacteroidales bacterium]|jgi:beta-glucosidase-like glycosyl hydrolase/CubicO group peptidase (beta-lactamase class C family)|nr:serine hydrolase [Bacteroidales bacterium]
MKPFVKIIFVLLCVSVIYGFLNPQSPCTHAVNPSPDPFANVPTAWADSVLKTMTLDEKIGQLFMVAVYANPKQSNFAQTEKLIRESHIGGVIFMQSNPSEQVRYTNHFQSISKLPLLISIDGEWGLAMRLDSTISFPKQLMLGAIADNTLIYAMGAEIARQCHRMGIHINFAPSVDINNNANNPVINFRSFGELRENVAQKGLAYMTGMQDNQILTTIKHFPGHGDTDTDSHFNMPVIPHKKARLDSVEFYPFRYLIQRGATGVMVAHLYVPELEKTKNIPSTLSPAIITNILRKNMDFKGLVFTDALNMQGIAKNFPVGDREIRALLAGNDVLLFPENVAAAISEIKAAIASKRISEDIITAHCRKILIAKTWSGLTSSTFSPIPLENLYKDLNTDAAKALNKKLIRAAITVAKDSKKQLPINKLETQKIAYVRFSDSQNDAFYTVAKNYTNIAKYTVTPANAASHLPDVLKKLKDYTTVIVNLEASTAYAAKNYGISDAHIDMVSQIAKSNNVILVLHGNPYILNRLTAVVPAISSIVVGYDFTAAVQQETPQVLFGALPANGTLPVTAGGIKAGTGITLAWQKRLRYAEPFDVGMNENTLQKIDSVIQVALDAAAMPGCQVLVARKGAVVYHKAFGTVSTSSSREVESETLYDIASITKAAATTVGLMKLYDEEKFRLDAILVDYLPQAQGSDKDTLRFYNILTHQSQLPAGLPFVQNMIANFSEPGTKSKKESFEFPYKFSDGVFLSRHFAFKDSTISHEKTDLYSVPVAHKVFINPAMKDSMFTTIFNAKLLPKKQVVYSDLGFMLMAEVIKNLSNQPIDQYMETEFYHKLGAHSLCYNPLRFFSKQQITPTEHDYIFRRQLIHGYVHDPAAAMLGGVSGHAGLFSNANDLAKVFQMLLNGGTYGDTQFIKPETIQLFTSCPFCESGNRKAYGFDRPEESPKKADNTCKCTSLQSYGHTGFTGTIAWADPTYEVLYIFLSNRVNPTADNKLLSQMNVRTTIQHIIYNAIE